MEDRILNAIKILDAMTLGCAGDIDIRVVTLEMSLKDAMRFLFLVSKHFQLMQRLEGPVRDMLALGQPFYYRGTWFRVIQSINTVDT